MPRLAPPDMNAMESFLSSQRLARMSYNEVGWSLNRRLPEGFEPTGASIFLGNGPVVWEAARNAMHQAAMFSLNWVRLYEPRHLFIPRSNLVVAGYVCGRWWMNACRVIQVVDSSDPKQLGVIYGTLPDHMEQGEERFFIEMRPNGDVVYDVWSFSRPGRWWLWPVKRHVRRVQARFVYESCLAMQAATECFVHRRSAA